MLRVVTMVKNYYAPHPYIKIEHRKKCLFEENNIPKDAKVRGIKKDEIIIEFDKPITREQAVKAVKQTYDNVIKVGYSVEVYDHTGRSPHLHIKNIKGLEELTQGHRKQYRLAFYDKYVPNEFRKYVDESFTSSFRWVALEGVQHYKGDKEGFNRGIKKLMYNNDRHDNKLELLKKSQTTNVVTKRLDVDNLIEGVDDGVRNTTALKFARRYAGKGLTKKEATLLLITWNEKNNPILTDKELTNAIDMAYKYEHKKEFEEAISFFTNKIDAAKKFIGRQPVYYERKGQFWIWDFNKYCWIMRDETDILNLISSSSIADTIKSKQKNEILEALKQVGRQNKPQDIKSAWVQFKDKIYDIENGDIIEATPKYFVANPIDRKVGISEDTPILDSLINSWVDNNDVLKLYELIAFTLVPKYFIHSFHFLYSPPGMGKSTFTNLIVKFIGKHNCASTTLDRINKNTRFETFNWHKKLLITLSEVNDVNDLTNTSIINQATGEDPIPAEIKGGETFDYVNYGKFIYPTNKLLKIDENNGFGRRARTVCFVNRFEKERDVLNEIPEYEFENLAKKCLLIASRLWKDRRFTGDLDISDRIKKYQELSKTPIESFVDSQCDLTDSEARIVFDDFYSKFITFNKKTISKIMVGKELRTMGFTIRNENWQVTEQTSQTTLSNNNSVVFTSGNRILGIKWKEAKMKEVK